MATGDQCLFDIATAHLINKRTAALGRDQRVIIAVDQHDIGLDVFQGPGRLMHRQITIGGAVIDPEILHRILYDPTRVCHHIVEERALGGIAGDVFLGVQVLQQVHVILEAADR
jgi:hypothetical protein